MTLTYQKYLALSSMEKILNNFINIQRLQFIDKKRLKIGLNYAQ